MPPLPFRILVAVSSLLVPRAKRSEWKQEWLAELRHRIEADVTPDVLLHCAAGVLRDAVWVWKTEYKHNGFDPFRVPLRTEAIFLAVIAAICGACGVFSPPTLPYQDPARVVVFQRKIPFMGARLSNVDTRLSKLLAYTGPFEGIANYGVLRSPAPALRVSSNFFDALGVRPALGRPFTDQEPDDSIILADSLWQSRFHRSASAIGQTMQLGTQRYRIVGIMPERFWFLSRQVQFYVPLPDGRKSAGAVARLAPGIPEGCAQAALHKAALRFQPPWYSESLEVAPVLQDSRLGDLLFSFGVAVVSAFLGVGFLILRRHGQPRYWLLLGARIFLILLGFSLANQLLDALNPTRGASSLFQFWIFLLVCVTALWLLVVDHRARCLVCLSKLRMPAPIGVWSSEILDQPATEYVCPEGHGTLYIAETSNNHDYWTVLDDSWKDLFARTEK
jgi:hypothetical protein